MKKLITTLLAFIFFDNLIGQATIQRQMPQSNPTILTQAAGKKINITGTWSGTQTNDAGLYPQAFIFQLTATGEFICGNQQTGIVTGRGTYTFSNNHLYGSYKVYASSETFSFSGVYDATTQTITFTQGIGTSIKGQGRITASKTTETVSLRNSGIRAEQPGTNKTITKNDPIKTTIPSTTNTNSSSNTPDISNSAACYLTSFSEYYLVTAKVIIQSGNDGKEFYSGLSANLSLPPGSSSYVNAGSNSTSLIFTTDDRLEDFKKTEYKANSIQTISMTSVCFPCSPGKPDYRPGEVMLSTIEKNGLLLDIYYLPNFFMDAWQIQKIELLLEFKRPDGTPHPTLGVKSIPFIIPAITLTNTKNKISLRTDRFLIQSSN